MPHLQLHVQTEEQHDETHSDGPWTQSAVDILQTEDAFAAIRTLSERVF